MKKLIIALPLILFCLAELKSQSTYKLPFGYKEVNNSENQRVDADFDNDGIKDLALVCSKNNESETLILIYLSSQYLVNKIHYEFLYDCAWASLVYKKEVLSISGSFGNGRTGNELKFKYYTKIGNMRLIGYDEFYLGSMQREGGYSKSVNFLTNKYVVNDIWKETQFDVITLKNIEQYTDYLWRIGEDLINK